MTEKEPYHNQQQYADQTLNWCSTDSEEQYNKNVSNNTTREQLQSLGWNFNSIQYRFNSHGFRTAEFDQPVDIACFGCSFTMGTGTHARDTWPEQLQALTGLTVANLGHAGSSNDEGEALRFGRAVTRRPPVDPLLLVGAGHSHVPRRRDLTK